MTFAIVWFYHSLTSAYLSGGLQIAAVVVLAIPTWLVLSRTLFPRDDDGFLDPFRDDRSR